MFCKKSSCTDLISACTLQISLRDVSFLLLLLPTISTGSFRATKTGDAPEAAAPPPTTHHTQGGQDDTNLQFPNSLHQRDQPEGLEQ